MKTFGITVWPTADMADLQVYEVETETPWWTLTQRVHWDDLPNVIAEAVHAVMSDTPPKP
jgi:hypothetical protein